MSTTRYQTPRGTEDVLPEAQPYWAAIDTAIREITRLFGYRRIDTPTFEDAELFEKGTGGTTDIVEKEMYVFTDRGEETLALTPEATPSICRAYLEHGMASRPQPVRLFTTARMFRYDRPQQGRYRQFNQFDCEAIGSADPVVDAELIELLWRLYERIGIGGVELRLASIDDPAPRHAYVERLRAYYRPLADQLSPDSQRRLERNALRLLDSKDERDQVLMEGAPKLVEQLSEPAAEHFAAVRRSLDAAGIPYVIDPLLVRGLDYYNRTVWEFVPKGDERAQSTIGAGGRYDGLIEIVGGPPTPGVGFATGIERLILEMQRQGVEPARPAGLDVFVVHRGEEATRKAIGVAGSLRGAGLATVVAEAGRSFRAQLRHADASGARFALILGEDEVARGAATVKDLRAEAPQEELPLDGIAGALAARRGGVR